MGFFPTRNIMPPPPSQLAVDQIGFAPCFTFVFLTVNYLLEGQTGLECQDSVRRDYQDVVVAGWMVRVLN